MYVVFACKHTRIQTVFCLFLIFNFSRTKSKEIRSLYRNYSEKEKEMIANNQNKQREQQISQLYNWNDNNVNFSNNFIKKSKLNQNRNEFVYNQTKQQNQVRFSDPPSQNGDLLSFRDLYKYYDKQNRQVTHITFCRFFLFFYFFYFILFLVNIRVICSDCDLI